MNNDPCYSFISREDVAVEAKATREGVSKQRDRGRWFNTIKTLLVLCANVCTIAIWRVVRTRVLTSSRWHQRAANEARDVASLWKRRGLTSILKRCVHPPSPPLSSLPTLRSVPPPGIAGALHLPTPFKARNDEALAPIPEEGERRRRDEGSRWTSAAGKRNSHSLIIRAVTLIFNRPARYSETKFESELRRTEGIIAK